MSNMGDMGDMGDRPGGSPGGGAALLPYRVDLPFAKEQPRVWDKDEDGKWRWGDASKDELEDLEIIGDRTWKPRDWSGKWLAWTVLTELNALPWRNITLEKYPSDRESVEKELKKLLRAAQDERPDAMGEIVAQNEDYTDCMEYFIGLLRISKTSHPKTCFLMHVAGLTGLLVVMHFKRHPGNGQDPRPRPSQLCPALLPPIEVPGHPAFPSGHATQAMLMALGIQKALPAPLKESLAPHLHALAQRIARNREIAGLHYESDSEGGFELAGKTFDLLKQCDTYKDAIRDAGAEWT